MKFYSLLLLVAFVVGAGSKVLAEQDIEIEIDNDIDKLYYQSPTVKKGAIITSTIAPQQQPQMMQSQHQQPQMMQSQHQQPVQTQPTTLIEASPLSDSRADMIRKNRQEEEMRTESRIVEKLEQSRMEDEKKRATVLFGDKFENMQNTQSSNVSAPAAVQAPPPAVVQPVYLEPKEELTRDAVREEVRAALSEDDTAVVPVESSRYFAGMAGIGEYPDVNNVKGNYTLGAAFGTRYDYFLVEGAFLMSNYSVDMNNTIMTTGFRTDNYEVNQYQGIIAAKYQLLGGVVRPVLGGLIAYSYRQFSVTNSFANSSQDTGNSHAVDLGITTGVDIEFSPKFSLGLDMKYMFNMMSRVNSNYKNSTYMTIGTPIEKLQYYIAGIAARVNF